MEELKAKLIAIGSKIEEMKKELYEYKAVSREALKNLLGKEYDDFMNSYVETVMKKEKAIGFAKSEFAKYQSKHRRLFLSSKN